MNPLIRDSRGTDVPAIHAIYQHHVLRGLATFEEVVPTIDELRNRRDVLRAMDMPHLVAELDGRVVGYCYAGPYRARPAYRFTVENSVYIEDGLEKRGIGTALLTELISRCEAGPWRQMVAVIGDSANAASIALHRRHGFRHVGTLEAVGYKLGRWVDTVFMQRALGPGSAAPPLTG
jgi:phosphinothricin acetyltransferase